jgi:hypothetical protein
MFKAPEPEVLKRKRSRPSDWWAAAPTTLQQDELLAKKRGGPSNLNADAKGMKDAPGAGNRGKSSKAKEVVRDGENGEEDELQEKPVRRGRSSGSGEELLCGTGSSRAAKKVEGRKGKGVQEVTEDRSAPKKRGRPAAAQVEGQAEEDVVEQLVAKRKGRPSVRRIEEHDEVAEPSKQSKSLRRGRSSNTEAEVRAITESGQNGIPKRSRRRPATEMEAEAEIEEPDEDPIAPQKCRRPAQRLEADHLEDEMDDSNPRREKKKKRRSGVEIFEAEALALTTTDEYAKGRPRTKPRTVVASRDDEEQGKARTRQSNIQDIRPTASSTVDQQDRGRARTRRSDAELQEETMAGPSKRSKPSRQRGQRVVVEAASSKLQSNRSGPKKGVQPVLEKRTKSARGSAAIEQPQKSKKRTRSSIEGAVERPVLEPPKSRKKGSERQIEEEAQSRKRKHVESKCLVPV